jgi:lipopolysaccharide/colanic/teichoic acid biosynthesis glycosyltransferase
VPIPAAEMQRRFLEIILSAIALVALLPLLAITAVAIKANSRGPVLFKQTRMGLKGNAFMICKFCSMATNAETRRYGLISTSDREGICFKSRTDPRVTRSGRIIWRFSIDELLQILNVLKGDMSIVGPRPALPFEVAEYPSRALGRLAVKPGITGLWQVSGRAEIGFEQMVEMDLSYAASRSLLLNLFLILKAFGAVTSGRGALLYRH